MKRQSVLVIVTTTFLFFPIGQQNVKADIYFSDGRTHTVDYMMYERLYVLDSSLGEPTTVNLVTGGHIERMMYAYDNSQVSISGGSIGLDLTAAGSSQVDMFSGSIGRNLWAYDNSCISIFGGSIGNGVLLPGSGQIDIYGGTIGGPLQGGYGQVNIYGGSIGNSVTAAGSMQLNIFDGSIMGGLAAMETGQVSISGGTIGDIVWCAGSSQITIVGSDFNYPYGTLTGSGLLTGILASGDLININFSTLEDARIVLTPVPSAVILGSIGLTFSGWLLRRRKML